MAISLRRRLILILLGLNLTAWLVSVVLAAFFAQQMIVEQIDRQLTHYMDMAQYSMGTVLGEPRIRAYFLDNSARVSDAAGITRVAGFGSQGREQAINIWFTRSQVLVGELTPAFPNPVREGVIEQVLSAGGKSSTWRIRYRHDEELDVWLAVGVDMAYAPNMGTTTVLRVILPLLVILPVSIAILLWGVGRGLRPLDHLATRIEARKPEALEPIEPAGVPGEILPVVTSLNNLLARLQRALSSEQRFTSNAAHELQTPLAAIKAEVQRCQRHVTDDDSRTMLKRIAARVTRAADTVTQLLTLARLDPELEFPGEPVLLNDLLIDIMADEGGVAAERCLDIQVDEDPDAVVPGHAEWLAILVRNLLGNAFKYAPVQGRVHISLRRRDRQVTLSVANDCEPLGDEQRARLTDRFYTLPGQEGGGVGLGLSIVKRIAELHGANLRLAEGAHEREFLAEVDFPAAPPPAAMTAGSAPC